mgnify:CR=1 FL=1
MFKKIVLLLGALIALNACQVKNTTPQPVQPPPPPPEKPSAGPYSVVFDKDTNAYHHSFKIDLDQKEGKVEYLLTLPVIAKIELSHTQLSVVGCSASQVTHELFWIPDQQKLSWYYVSIGSTFTTEANTEGKLIHIVKGLEGCQSLTLSTTLKRL